MEMVLRFNLGPIHLLDGFIDEILAYDSTKNYLRKEAKISRVVSNNLNKSAAISTYEKNEENKSRFPNLWGHSKTMLTKGGR